MASATFGLLLLHNVIDDQTAIRLSSDSVIAIATIEDDAPLGRILFNLERSSACSFEYSVPVQGCLFLSKLE